ncbi:uncharacterized protein [Rutidosis leptorrhynchoides]|uniref:uncharacterized protein isoform X2 n=1 Tax=Rutidosis leptorrhynchoides TaxID=125765 RepID=UPI003A9A2B7F
MVSYFFVSSSIHYVRLSIFFLMEFFFWLQMIVLTVYVFLYGRAYLKLVLGGELCICFETAYLFKVQAAIWTRAAAAMCSILDLVPIFYVGCNFWNRAAVLLHFTGSSHGHDFSTKRRDREHEFPVPVF